MFNCIWFVTFDIIDYSMYQCIQQIAQQGRIIMKWFFSKSKKGYSDNQTLSTASLEDSSKKKVIKT